LSIFPSFTSTYTRSNSPSSVFSSTRARFHEAEVDVVAGKSEKNEDDTRRSPRSLLDVAPTGCSLRLAAPLASLATATVDRRETGSRSLLFLLSPSSRLLSALDDSVTTLACISTTCTTSTSLHTHSLPFLSRSNPSHQLHLSATLSRRRRPDRASPNA
jgi:hypothetical protein